MILTHHDHDDYLKQMHLFLNQMYYIFLYCDDETYLPSDALIKKFKNTESHWISQEKQDCLSKYDFNQEVKEITAVESALKKHPVYNHHIFDYFSLEASKDDIKKFLLNESILNLEFFDYLAYSIIGASDLAKSEIIINLWEKAGKGDVNSFHTNMFNRLIKDLGLIYKRDIVIANMSWEALAGINLFSYMALYPFNKQKYFGLLAATEMLNPLHYKKLIQGLSRLFHSEIDITYYAEHEVVDKTYATNWVQKIIIPELIKQPEKTMDFWQGFYLRLDSVQRYYDSLLHAFLTKQAA